MDDDDLIPVSSVADDFGKVGRAWREADYEATDLETVFQDLLSGQYNDPIRVVAFNTGERWSEDVSADVAAVLRRRCDLQLREVPSVLSDFLDRHEGLKSPAIIAAAGLTDFAGRLVAQVRGSDTASGRA